MLIKYEPFGYPEENLPLNTGFSILEVLIAISIFAIGLLAVASLLISSGSGNRIGNTYSTASVLAQMKIEELKSLDFDSPALAAGAYADPNNPINEIGDTKSVTENGIPLARIYTRTWTVVNGTTFSREITVRVTGNNQIVEMSTITRGGGN